MSFMLSKKAFSALLPVYLLFASCAAQKNQKETPPAVPVINDVIHVAEVERIERTLASDEMEGRRPFTPGIDKAAAFIAAEFRKTGIRPIKDTSYFQEFLLIRPRITSLNGSINNKTTEEKDIAVRSTLSSLSINHQSGF